MYKILTVVTLVLITACIGQNKNVTQTTHAIICGVLPPSIYRCLGNPKLVKPDVSSQCTTQHISECQRIKCIFRKSGWLNDEKVDKEAVTKYFTNYAKDHPEWTQAVDQVTSICLSGDLQPQGVYVDCSPYDVIHCAITQFFKNAQSSQWSTANDCEYARSFAGACPICPEDCFSPMIPIGSCNACRLLSP